MTSDRSPTLLVFGGLPGTGKTTISRELATRLNATYLRVDAIEQALRQGGLAVGSMGYAIANAIAAENLKLHRTVVADCVNPVLASVSAGDRPPRKLRHALSRSNWSAAIWLSTSGGRKTASLTSGVTSSQAGRR
ncbi:AAA family ATPase [Bradyrhizobium japonicum]|uniref:AAA family ATPase n=1 Tax=Bradyrhizobium japonicum TaxID=375 RepID=UPI0009B7A0F4|nr:AAA family ATPase [Bradyrhizobium japonicum]